MMFIARHCRTAWNLENRLQGSLDPPLCKEGRAEALANVPNVKSLGIRRIITSPARRAIQTARIYASQLHIAIEPHDGLRELDHGQWEGQSIDDLMNPSKSSYALWLEEPSSVEIPGGSENAASAQARIVEAVREIARRYPDERVLIITHKHIRALLACAFKGLPLTHFRSQIEEGILPAPLIMKSEGLDPH